MKYLIYTLVLVTLVFSACKKKQAKRDQDAINKYIQDNPAMFAGANVQSTPSGLHYVISLPGAGLQPSQSSIITVKYVGKLTDNSTFDQSNNFRNALSSLIEGWKEGIPLIKEGGKIKLLIPSELGYGSQATGSIPANSVLIFDIELLKVE